MDSLDQLDAKRHDALAMVDAANEFSQRLIDGVPLDRAGAPWGKKWGKEPHRLQPIST